MTTKYFMLIFALFWSVSNWGNTSATIDFGENDLSALRANANAQGKQYFVIFTAEWCTPCKWMDQNTFTEPILVDFVEQNYLAAKVDIDDFTGNAYKQQYNIRVLPTIIIFDKKGKVAEKIEKSLNASDLLNVLKKHQIEKETNKIISSPVRPIVPEKIKKETPIISRPPLKPSTNRIPEEKNPKSVTSVDEGLFHFTATRQDAEGFSVQVGVFKAYGNVLVATQKLEERFNEKVLVQISNLDGTTVYKVLLGVFDNHKAASSFKELLKPNYNDVFVKNLAAIQ